MNAQADPIELLQGYLARARRIESQPFYLLVDDDWRVLEARGQAGHYGFDRVDPGTDLGDSLLFLVGQEKRPGATLHLPVLALPDGGYCEVYGIRLRNGWGLAFTDASPQQQLQARYQQMAHELALAQHRLKLQHAELEAANTAKSRFIARMSHEFRTPLASILGFAELAREDMHDPERLAGDLEAIVRGANYLMTLVENLLDHAVLEQGELIVRPAATEPARLVEDLRQLFEPGARQKGLTLDWRLSPSVPPRLWIDGVRLRQILVNLIGNALKFTREGGITLSIEWRGDRLRVRVEDTGIGIPSEAQARLFQPFAQTEEGRSERGAGLGLSISRELVRRMGGELTLHSRPGEGTVVQFDIHAPARDEETAPEPSLEGQRVLLLEQDADIRKLLAIFMKSAGMTVFEAETLEQARPLLAQQPQVVVCHLLEAPQHRMLLRELRRAGFEGPLLAVGASDDQEQLEQVRSAGYADLLTKPVRRTELLSRLCECLGRGLVTPP